MKLTGLDEPILRALNERGPLGGGQIANVIDIQGAEVGSRLTSLRKRGLIAHAGIRWELTDDGHNALKETTGAS